MITPCVKELQSSKNRRAALIYVIEQATVVRRLVLGDVDRSVLVEVFLNDAADEPTILVFFFERCSNPHG